MNLFAYGTLMASDILAAVANVRLESRAARLDGYRRHGVEGQVYPALRPQAGACVDGRLYLDLPDPVWQALDLFEGEMYERISVQVRDEAGRRHGAEVYLCRPASYPLLTEADWDFERFLQSDKERFGKEVDGGWL